MHALPNRHFHRDFMLSCSPTPTPDGRFQARVAITYLGGERTRSQRFLDLDVFDTAEAAIEHARRAGIEWVDLNYGD
jgi:hypothetical protein